MTSYRDTTTFLPADSAAEPRCIDYSDIDDSILICLTFGSYRTESRVIWFCGFGTLVRMIECDIAERRLYERPDYIRENKTGPLMCLIERKVQ